MKTRKEASMSAVSEVEGRKIAAWLANLSRLSAEPFLDFLPSGPQAFERFYGTIQAGSQTERYVLDSEEPSGSSVGEFLQEMLPECFEWLL